ncbi:MAG: NAD(P)-dependent dehydrogenase (short-subunit alcohol dehydrogenase family) [Rickettsiales bacterium]|jgi:NAD(P)-dependent dehydrogenase (short-subunit alcohol dehydrogenase family)
MQKENLNIAIIGASGSLGEMFVKQLAQNPQTKSIFAFSRSKTDFDNEKTTSHFIDIEDEESIKSAVDIASENAKLDMVIVATGMLHNQDFGPEKSLRDLSKEKFQKLFNVNTIAPAIIAKHFLPKLNRERKSVFAAISARVGSISDNHLGGWYSYRASKSALNMVLKNASIEIGRSNKNAVIIGLHPGTVDSKLSKPFQGAVSQEKLFTPEYSVEKLLEVIENSSPKDSGKIIDFNGVKIEF